MHVHSVAVSGDGIQDLGVLSQRAQQIGLNAIFLTDHGAGSNYATGSAIANHIKFDEGGMTYWKADTYGTLSSSVNSLVTTPTAGGTQALHLSATSSGYGETFIWQKRGPSLRSGDLILKFSVYPVRIDPGSGVYVSVAIGGDPTLGAVSGTGCDSSTGSGRPPNGYTTSSGVISPGKANVLVWQLGTPRTASTDPNNRLIPNNLPYTLNTWNNYVIDVSNGQTTWNGNAVSGLGHGIQDIPAADQPVSYNALSQLKMTAAGNAGTAEAYFDNYYLDASAPVSTGDEFVYRNSIVHTYDNSTYKVFPGLEAGLNNHVSRFNYAITSASQWSLYNNGNTSIPDTQATGYPAQIDHPGLPGGISQTALLTNNGYGTDLMEAVPRGGNEIMITLWDDLLKQNIPIIGTWSSDAHRTERLNEATYIYAPSLDFDPLVRSVWEGRAFMANSGFAGRVAFNLDRASSTPYPARYPVYVPPGPVSENVHLSISAGVPSGAKVNWIANGAVIATDSTSGSSYNATKPISVSGAFTYVRAELRSMSGTLIAMTEPIFFETVASLPASMSFHVDGVTTADGKGYTRTMTKGITQGSYDATNGLSLTLVNLPGSLVENEVATGNLDASGVKVDGVTAPASASLTAFNAATTTTWFYDSTLHVLHMKTIEGSTGTTTDVVGFAAGADTQPPSVPTGVSAAATGTSSTHLSWAASHDNVGVAGYTIYRNGVEIQQVDGSTLSYDDSGLTPNTTYTYTVDAFDNASNHSAQSAGAIVQTEQQLQLVLTPVADTYVNSGSPSSNYGTSTTLRLDASPVNRTFLRFDVEGLTGTFENATLRLFSKSTGSGYSVRSVADTTWGETTTTYNNAPAFSSTAAATAGSFASGVWSETDVSSLISGNGLVSLAVTTGSSTAESFSSREGTSPPQLVINMAVAAGPNAPPVASDVSLSAATGVATTWKPSVSDPDGDTLTCSIATQPAHGTASVSSNCSSGSYTSSAGYSGADTFTYKVSDGITSATAHVNVTVSASNRAPTANAVSASTTAGQAVTVSLSATDPDGNCPLTFATGSPAHGTLGTITGVTCSAGSASASVAYTPAAGFSGNDSFTYTATDPAGAVSAPATATIAVSASSGSTVFSDGFESGTFGSWSSVTGLVTESTTVAVGSFAAEGATTNGTTWAKKVLSTTYPELTYRLRFRVHSRASGSSIMLLKFRTAADRLIGGVFVDGTGKLAVRNDIAAANTASTTVIALDTWYTLSFHLKVNGTASVDDVTLNGSPVAALSSTAANFGTNPIGELQLGEPNAAKTYDVFFDDVAVSSP